MNILFVHNNFPAQFRHVARALSLDPQVNVAAIGSATAQPMPNVTLQKYPPLRANVAATHPFARRFDVECRRADQVFAAATSLVSAGFRPDAVVAHPGWGETLPLRPLFPQARMVAYCEFFYGPQGRDVGFDPEFPAMSPREVVGLSVKNAATLLALIDADEGISPTLWQRSIFPPEFQGKIKVLHEGVDVDVARPNTHATLRLADGRILTGADEVVTYSVRSLEPLRGLHIFMRAIPKILVERPAVQILIIGDETKSPYGAPAPKGQTWKAHYFAEIENKIDPRRVHFTGALAYHDFLSALQVSSAHVYLTYPFVLSWSLVEAMSCGCLLIASDTGPVRDVIDGENGILFPFFASEQLADHVIDALAHPARYQRMRCKAREHAVERFDMRRTCVPQFLATLGKEPVGSWLANT
jgi:glycosyltransferase involved in cell wall biosynthesis